MSSPSRCNTQLVGTDIPDLLTSHSFQTSTIVLLISLNVIAMHCAQIPSEAMSVAASEVILAMDECVKVNWRASFRRLIEREGFKSIATTAT